MITYQFLTSSTQQQTREIITLYREAAWWSDEKDDEELVGKIMQGSHCFLVALEEEKIVGMGRAISDHAHDAYLQDVTVHHGYRHRGVGHHLVSRLLERLHEDGIRWIGLIAGRGTHPFYHIMGFSVMPNATPMLLDYHRWLCNP